MSRQDDSVRMGHMLDHAREAVAMITDRTRTSLDADRLLQLAIIRLVEIIGEAASRVTTQGRARYAAISWNEVIDIRHRIIHGCDNFDYDYDIVWRILTEELPVLIAALERALPEHAS